MAEFRLLGCHVIGSVFPFHLNSQSQCFAHPTKLKKYQATGKFILATMMCLLQKNI